MDKLLNKSKEEIAGIFEETAARLNLIPHIIEKDFWVCWVLKKIYSIPEYENTIIFKGGTSLSKAYGLIERFSEDVDLTVDKSILGSLKSPVEDNISGKEQARRIKTLIQAAEKYITEKFYPLLSNAIKQSLNKQVEWRLEIDSDRQTILFYYPQLLDSLVKASYIKPIIRLELGARGSIIPKEKRAICPYIVECFPDLLEHSSFLVPTLSVERTFWEKITILHSLYHRQQNGKKIGHRMSRHYYDVYMMDQKDITTNALEQKELLKEVVKNNIVFFKDISASYEDAKLGELKLSQTAEMLHELRQDYKGMEVMMLGNYPTWHEITLAITKLEKRLNSSGLY